MYDDLKRTEPLFNPYEKLQGIKQTATSPLFQSAQTAPQQNQTLPVLDRNKAVMRGNIARGLAVGSAFSQPTGDTSPLSVGNLAQMGAATALGFVTGDIPGGVTALVTSGLNSFLQSRAEKRRQKQYKQLRADAEKARKEQMAREDRDRRIERMDRLEDVRYNRNQAALRADWDAFQSVNNQFINTLNTNQQLKERFARMGF